MLTLLTSIAFATPTYEVNDSISVAPDAVDQMTCFQTGTIKAPTPIELLGYTGHCEMEAQGLVAVVRGIKNPLIGQYRREVWLCVNHDIPTPVKNTECWINDAYGNKWFNFYNSVYSAWL